MVWQDIIISIVSLLFGFVMFPQLKDAWHGKTVLNSYTSGLTSFGLFVMAGTFLTLSLWISFISELFSGVIWSMLFFLSLKYRKKTK